MQLLFPTPPPSPDDRFGILPKKIFCMSPGRLLCMNISLFYCCAYSMGAGKVNPTPGRGVLNRSSFMTHLISNFLPGYVTVTQVNNFCEE